MTSRHIVRDLAGRLLAAALASFVALTGFSTLAVGEDVGAPAGVMSTPRTFHSATLLDDGRVLVVGGWADDYLATAEIWDPDTRSFVPTGSLATKRADHSAFLLTDGGVLVVGGLGDVNGVPVAEAERWDPDTGEFQPAGKLRKPRVDATVTNLTDGRVLVVGGRVIGGPKGENGPVLEAEVWDPSTQTLEPAGSLPSKRLLHSTVALVDGGALVVGGTPGRGALYWNPDIGAFEPAGRMSGRRSRAVLLADGRVLAVGVDDPVTCKEPGHYAKTPDAELWDPETFTFQPVGAFVTPRNPHDLVALPNGGALAYGGWDAVCMDAQTFPTAESWNLTTQSFRRAGRTELGREGHTVTVLSDGRVAFLGGTAEVVVKRTKRVTTTKDMALRGTEVWSPVRRGFIRGADLVTARSGHTATLLPNGSILVVGGTALGPLTTAELWQPPSP